MNDEQKKEVITAKRGTLENELYAAELDLKVAEAGDAEELVTEPKARVERIQAQIAVLDDEEAQLD